MPVSQVLKLSLPLFLDAIAHCVLLLPICFVSACNSRAKGTGESKIYVKMDHIRCNSRIGFEIKVSTPHKFKDKRACNSNIKSHTYFAFSEQ